MNSKTTWIFYEKWWFWAIFFILIIRACNKIIAPSPDNNLSNKKEEKIDILKIIGIDKHTFVKDNNERYATLYSEWPKNIKLNSDSTFNINCRLETCGDYELNGNWGEPIKIDFYNEKELPYDIRRNVDWMRKGELIKVPLSINPVDIKRCETNTIIGYRESLLPKEIYGFMLVHYSIEEKRYIPYLFSQYIVDKDFSGRGKTMVSIFDMSK